MSPSMEASARSPRRGRDGIASQMSERASVEFHRIKPRDITAMICARIDAIVKIWVRSEVAAGILGNPPFRFRLLIG